MGINSTFVISTGAIDHFAGGDLLVTGSLATANIFATYLPEHMTLWQGFLDEVSDQDRRVLDGIVSRHVSATTDLGSCLSTCDVVMPSVGCHGIYSPGVLDRNAPAGSLRHHRQAEQPSASGD